MLKQAKRRQERNNRGIKPDGTNEIQVDLNSATLIVTLNYIKFKWNKHFNQKADTVMLRLNNNNNNNITFQIQTLMK